MALLVDSCGKRNEQMPKSISVNEDSAVLDANTKDVSERWKKDRGIDDFIYLKDNWVRVGCNEQIAKDLLGEPLSFYRSEDGIQSWFYVRCDAEKKQFYSWTLCLDAKGKVTRWHCKGIR